ncbi:MAG: hypothetical protein QMB63_02960 [Clostridiaceae bacterium]
MRKRQKQGLDMSQKKNNRNLNSMMSKQPVKPATNGPTVDVKKRKLMETTALNSMLLYGVFVFFLRSGRLSADSIKLSFGVIGLYVGSVYLRYILNYFRVKKNHDTIDIVLLVVGPLIILAFILGILGVVLGA